MDDGEPRGVRRRQRASVLDVVDAVERARAESWSADADDGHFGFGACSIVLDGDGRRRPARRARIDLGREAEGGRLRADERQSRRCSSCVARALSRSRRGVARRPARVGLHLADRFARPRAGRTARPTRERRRRRRRSRPTTRSARRDPPRRSPSFTSARRAPTRGSARRSWWRRSTARRGSKRVTFDERARLPTRASWRASVESTPRSRWTAVVFECGSRAEKSNSEPLFLRFDRNQLARTG